MPHEHNFHPVSGWCSRCGLRDDGRLVDRRTGIEFRPGPTYTSEQLLDFIKQGQKTT